MSKAQDIFTLLKEREGTWVTRDDLNFVGGSDAARRMREMRDNVSTSGQYRLDERLDQQKRLEYRLVKIDPHGTDALARTQWSCTKCDSYPSDMKTLQPSMDPRWKMGHCRYCRNPRAIFKQIGGTK
jgi:hypothetical protein